MHRPGIGALVLAFVLAAAPLVARGQERAPSSRPFYFGGGAGISFGVGNDRAFVKLQEEVGFELDPISLGGPLDLRLRLGGDFAQHFGDFTILQFGGRFSAAFGVFDGGNVGIRITPSVVLGGAVALEGDCDRDGFCSDRTSGGFHIGFAAQGELELIDGALSIWFRPVAIEGFVGPFDETFALWNVLAGVDVHL